MQQRIKINHIKINSFDPKTLLAQLEISFAEGEKQQKIFKEYTLKHPENLLSLVLLEIKSTNRILIDDVTLDPVEKLEIYSPIIIEKGEETETKMYNFLKSICEKAARLKNTSEATEYMKLLNEFKTSFMQL